MKFAIKSLAFAAAVVAGSAQAVIVTPGTAIQVVDPTGATTRTAEFKLLSSYSGGNVNAGSFSTGGDLIFGIGTYKGGAYIPGLSGTSSTPSSVTGIGGAVAALNTGKITLTGQDGVTVSETYRARSTDKNVYPNYAAALASLSNPATQGYVNNNATTPLAPLATTANTTTITRISAVANSSIASLDAVTTGPNAGQILVANAVGGAFQRGTEIPGTLTGGTLLVENIRFDLANRTVIADVTGDPDPVDGEGDIESETRLSFPVWTWTAADEVGPTSLKPASVLAADPVAALAADGFTLLNQVSSGQLNPLTPNPTDTFQKYTVLAQTQFKNLQITEDARLFFIQSFGLGDAGKNALNAVNGSLGGWGTVASNIVFEVQEVPEPSTYALMGLGLVGISLVARRRSAAK